MFRHPPTPPDPGSDAGLVARAVAGDTAAFGALVRRHQRPLFGYLGRMGLSQGEAEDLAQDSFIRAWRSLSRFEPERAAFSTWLYTIARRLALNLLSGAAHRSSVDVDPALALQPADAAGEPAEALARGQRMAWLQAGLHALPLADRSVLALAYVHDMSLAQLAAVEGLSEPAARARLHRARQRLREILSSTGADHDT